MISPIASRTYAQWPELAERWGSAVYAGNVLQLPAERAGAETQGTGGVFVIVGTNEARFTGWWMPRGGWGTASAWCSSAARPGWTPRAPTATTS